MDPDAFRRLLGDAGLNQRELAFILGVSAGSVNRWCSRRRKDHVEAPRSAVAFLTSYSLLSAAGRATFWRLMEDAS